MPTKKSFLSLLTNKKNAFQFEVKNLLQVTNTCRITHPHTKSKVHNCKQNQMLTVRRKPTSLKLESQINPHIYISRKRNGVVFFARNCASIYNPSAALCKHPSSFIKYLQCHGKHYSSYPKTNTHFLLLLKRRRLLKIWDSFASSRKRSRFPFPATLGQHRVQLLHLLPPARTRALTLKKQKLWY